MFTQTIDVCVRWKGCFDAKVLGFKNQGIRCRTEQNLGSTGTTDRKRERRLGIVEDNCRSRQVLQVSTRTRQHISWHFIAGRSRIRDFDVNSGLCYMSLSLTRGTKKFKTERTYPIHNPLGVTMRSDLCRTHCILDHEEKAEQ